MDDAPAVGKGHRIAHLAENQQQAVQCIVSQHVRFLTAQPVEDRLEGAALHHLHGVEQRHAVLPHDVVDRHDVGMRQHRQHLRLPQKPLPRRVALLRLQMHHLDGDRPLQFRIARLEDAGHPAACDLLPHLIIVGPRRWRRHRHGLRLQPGIDDRGLKIVVQGVGTHFSARAACSSAISSATSA